jgi:hypothetical protein
MVGNVAAGVRLRHCKECQRLRQVYWKAIVEVDRFECIKRTLGAEATPEADQTLAAQLKEAEQARKTARDALVMHHVADHS